MEHLTGLQWSAGLFGLAIGMVIGAVLAWAMREHERRADGDPKLTADDFPPLVPGPSAGITLTDAPLGDIPAVPEPLERHGNPLVIRMYERWLDADARGDAIAVRRQEIRMLSNGVDTPWSRADAETRLARLKGEAP